MKKMNLLFGVLTLLSASCGDKESEGVFTDKDLTCTPSEISVDCLSNSVTVNVTAIREWTVYSDEDWISCHPTGSIDPDRKSTRLNSSHANISYAVFCLKKKKNKSQ